MNTENTDEKEFKGWVLYDADCRLCAGLAKRLHNLLAARRFELLPLQTPWVGERLGTTNPELLEEMRLLRPDGRVFGGADALLEICRYYRLTWPIRQAANGPAAKKLIHMGYRWIARNRHCANGACRFESTPTRRQHHRFTDFLPLLAFPLLALACRPQPASWIFMWSMAFALYAGCKWLTYCEAIMRGMAPSWRRALGYLSAWPGMDAAAFLNEKKVPAKPGRMEWSGALATTGFGAILLYWITRLAFAWNPLAGGWTGMTGIVLLLHFGLFHIGSLLWRRAGVPATVLMRHPVMAKSVAEFWGERWNTAFNEIAFRYAYRPLRRRFTPALATLLVFGGSGLIHELVISLPARAGYGLPTAYFLIQGLGVMAERSRLGQRIGLGHGLCGRLFAMLLTAGPVFWLFNPTFVKRVILPMLTAIGAT